MNPFESAPAKPEKSLVERIADKALELRKTWPWPNNIYKALDAFKIDAAERERFISEVSRELGQRKKGRPGRKRARLIEDAAQSEGAKYEREEKEREEGE